MARVLAGLGSFRLLRLLAQQDRPPQAMTNVEMVPTLINGRWPLILPAYRAARPEAPWWEATRLASMHHFLAQGAVGSGDLWDYKGTRPIIYDIGAEEGDWPALWSTWGLDVVLVEPNPHTWPNIRAIFDANDLDHPLDWFVGFCSDQVATPMFQDFDSTDQAGWPECAYGPLVGDHGFRHLAQQTDTTPQTTLDELVAANGHRPDALTIDVEGAELRVLKGAQWVLDECRPKCWISVHEDFMLDLYDESPMDLFEFMTCHRYERTYLCTDHERHEMWLPK